MNHWRTVIVAAVKIIILIIIKTQYGRRVPKALIEKLHSGNKGCSSAKQHHVNVPQCSRVLLKFSAMWVYITNKF